MKHIKIAAAFAACALASIPGAAVAAVVLPASFVVPNDPAAGAAGYDLAVTNVSDTDVISFSVSGTPFLQQGSTYGVNAAGVVTVAGTSPVGSSLSYAYTYGSLLLSLGNLGTVQVFPTNASNGLGSSAPPTTLNYTGTLGSLFGNFSPLTASTLNFRVADTGFDDNSGSFQITSLTSAVPEPATWAMMIGGFGMVGGSMRSARRRRQTVKVSLA